MVAANNTSTPDSAHCQLAQLQHPQLHLSTPQHTTQLQQQQHQQPQAVNPQQQQHLQPQQQQQEKAKAATGQPGGHVAAPRRIAVLECEDAERWRGYTESLWKAALWEEGDEWVMYQVCQGELPSPSEASTFDALLVSGSHYSVYEELLWIQALLEALQQYAAAGVRIYGCCFGCQALAQALGGSVGPNPDGNFVLTIEQVTPVTTSVGKLKQLGPVLQAALKDAAAAAAAAALCEKDTTAAGVPARGAAAVAAAAVVGSSSSISSASSGSDGSNDGSSDSSDAVTQGLEALSLQGASGGSSSNGSNGSSGNGGCSGSNGSSEACKSDGCFQLIESHGDQVLTLPPGAVVLASSPTAPYELWSWGPNVLASQFHLEFDEPLVIEKIWSRLTDIGRLDAAQSAASRARLEAGGQHNVQMLQVVKHFLKHGIH